MTLKYTFEREASHICILVTELWKHDAPSSASVQRSISLGYIAWGIATYKDKLVVTTDTLNHSSELIDPTVTQLTNNGSRQLRKRLSKAAATDDKKKLDHRRIKGILLDKMVVALYTGKLSHFNFQVLQGKIPSHLISLVMICWWISLISKDLAIKL